MMFNFFRRRKVAPLQMQVLPEITYSKFDFCVEEIMLRMSFKLMGEEIQMYIDESKRIGEMNEVIEVIDNDTLFEPEE